MHINFSVKSASGGDCMPHVIAGVMDKIAGITLFMNPVDASYLRIGGAKAPGYITWSSENRSQLIRIPAATGEFKRAELRSPKSSRACPARSHRRRSLPAQVISSRNASPAG